MPTSAGTLTFVGTATTVLRLGSFVLLTDPNFLRRGQRAYLGKGLWSRRLTDPACTPEELPTVDAVVLSHLHGDHFDRVARRSLSREPPVLTTPKAAERLRQWRFAAHGLETWSTHTLRRDAETLTVEAMPGIHARGALAPLLPPVMGSMLHYEGGGTSRLVYITGDTVTGEHLEEIGRRFPSIDTVVAHLGGTRVLFHTVTMDAAMGVELARRVPSDRIVPVHYDDYRCFRSPVRDFVDAMGREGLPTQLQVPERGTTVALW